MSIITYNCPLGGLPEKLIAHWLDAQIKMKMSVPQMPNVHWMVNKIKAVVKCPTDHCGVMWRAVVMYYDGTRQRSADAYVGMMSRSIWKVWACLESIHRLGTDREGNWRGLAEALQFPSLLYEEKETEGLLLNPGLHGKRANCLLWCLLVWYFCWCRSSIARS